MRKSYNVGVARCVECGMHRGFYTEHPEDYVLKCWNCDRHMKLKDKRCGGWRTRVYWLESNSMSVAQRVAQVLNEQNSPRHQRVLKKEMEKPPHRRRKIQRLLRDVTPSNEFRTYSAK